jgi:hypothetical protein
MRARTVALAAVAWLCVVDASARVPEKIDVRDAMLKGKMAFWARVRRAELVSDQRLETIARVYLDVTECFYGASCRTGRQVTLRYRPFVVKEQADPIPFVAVGGEALVILSSNDALKRDGLIDDEGADRMLFSDPPQIGALLADMDHDKRRLIQGMRPAQEIALGDLRAWAKERK